MASLDRRRGKWRAQVRRGAHTLCKTFARKGDAEAWAREIEAAIDRGIDPGAKKLSQKDTLGTLIDLHIEDFAKHRKRIRRSKAAVLRRLKADIGDVKIAHLSHSI